MAILIDPPRWPAHGRVWSHLVSDTSIGELHAFARAAGIPRRGFEGDHYDVPEERYAALVASGARPVETRDVLRALVDSGLRMPKRKGERGIERARKVPVGDGQFADVDLIVGPREVPESRVWAAVTFVRDVDGRFALVHSPRRSAWGPPGGRREPGETVRECAAREIQEEIGLAVSAAGLVPIGYERFVRRPRTAGTQGRDLLQAFTTTVPQRRPRLRATESDTSDREWVTLADARSRCGGEFWWPIAEEVFGDRSL